MTRVKPELGPGISERVWEAVRSTGDIVDVCHRVKKELRTALTGLIGVCMFFLVINLQHPADFINPILQ